MSLRPARALAETGVKARGLFVIDAHVIVPQNALAVAGGLNLQLKVLGKRHGGPSAALVQVLRRYGKARAADHAVEAQPAFGVLEKPVGNGIGHVIEHGHHAFAVFAAQVALDDVRLALCREVLAVDLQKHVGVDQVVGVKEHDQVVMILISGQGVERLLQNDGLAGRRIGTFLVAFQHVGPHAARHFHGPVRAIIGKDIKVIQLARIFHVLQVVDDIRNDRFLVVSGHKHQKAHLRIVILIVFGIALEAKEADAQLVEQHQYQPGAHDTHDSLNDCRYDFHRLTSFHLHVRQQATLIYTISPAACQCMS